MPKELPYFKFEPSEWNDGKITLCTFEEQGLFINLCSLYWSKVGVIQLKYAKRRYSECSASAWQSLIDDDLIEIKDEHIIIRFLDDQFKDRKILSEKNRLNALEMWKKKRAQSDDYAIASESHAIKSREEESRREEKREEKKREKKPSDKKPKGDDVEIFFPFDSLKFKANWEMWKQYKKDEHKFQYKSAISEQASLKKLGSISNNEDEAINIIHQSIGNTWKGFFKIKHDGKSEQTANERTEQFTRVLEKMERDDRQATEDHSPSPDRTASVNV